MFDWVKVKYGESDARERRKEERFAARNQRKREKALAKQQKKANEPRIISVTIWHEETKHKSGAGRAIAGGLMFGTAGAVVGAATAKDKEFTTFRVEWDNGKIEYQKCANGSFAYNVYLGIMQQLDGGLR